MKFLAWLLHALHLDGFVVEDNKITPGMPCACKGKWNEYPETKHGSAYCMRSSTLKV